MDYPESISPYIYRRGFDKICEHKLNDKGVGAFAFYEVVQPANTQEKNLKTYHKAMAKSRGNMYYASKYYDRAQEVGFAMVLNGGIIKHLVLSCRKLRHVGKTKDALLKDMVEKGMPIDPKKLCDEAEMYRVFSI